MTPRSTKSAKSSPRRSIADGFATDPAGAVLGVLAEADSPLGKKEIAARLADGGVDPVAFEKAWRSAQERVRFDDHVIYERQKYRWTTTPREISLEERIYRITRTPDPATPEKLMALVRDAMEGAAADPVELADARRRAADAERRVAALQQRIDELVAAASVSSAAGPSATGSSAARSSGTALVPLALVPPPLVRPRRSPRRPTRTHSTNGPSVAAWPANGRRASMPCPLWPSLPPRWRS